MILHNDRETFTTLIQNTAAHFQIPDQFVEKDYYISLFLKGIQARFPYIIFKGGTSLSKCFKVINRFSEDIDLGYSNENNKLTNAQKKQLKKIIVDIVEELQFDLINEAAISSRKNFNEYEIEYTISESVEDFILRDHLLIETYLFLEPFPYEEKEFTSYITEYLTDIERPDLIDAYEIASF
ncbi:putative nucleotidyltransferase component of viral defense system [Filibacter limicola]|uniref:Nucleotidyltransferase component of viral defense system n=1 Tax=Sporosarcina limicola TaxID=34101 RepID=A0A927R6C7_9BACL|nr:putative nucleotidyltransferase component of viral defense system [Sporosarcina limicola]